MSFFGTNPLSTQVGQLIERATDPTTPDDNVELVYEICDVINVKEENARDALKAIRKKLSIYAGRNWSVVIKLLSLVDVCVSNCNKRFHSQIANKDFLNELKNMIGPKLQPPIVVQEKVLSLIQKWANAFKHDSELKGVENFYNDLRTKGIDFPVVDETKDILDPVNIRPTLSTTTTTSASTEIHQQQQQRSNTMIRPHQQQNVASGGGAAAAAATALPISLTSQEPMPTITAAITLTAEQLAKLNSELDIVECNVQVFNDVINELTQTQTQSNNLDDYNAEIELLRELYRTCKDMQARITQLVTSITNESLINELLRVNDDLNNVFLRHERFERGLPPNQNTTLTAGGGAAANSRNQNQNIYTNVEPSASNRRTPVAAAVSRSKPAEEQPLIDFGDDVNTNANKISKIHLTSTNEYENVSNDPSTAFLQDENEIKEIENWLKTQGDSGEERTNTTGRNDFDEFLNERLSASTAAAAATATSNTGNNRTVKTDTKSKFEL